MALVHGEQCPGQLRQTRGHFAQLGQGYSAFRLGHGRQRIAQLGQQARLFIFRKLLDVNAQHPVNLEQHRHRERALVLLEDELGRQGIRQMKLRVAGDNLRAKHVYDVSGFRVTGFNMSKIIEPR